MFYFLFFIGVCLGRLCIYHKFGAIARFCIAINGKILKLCVRRYVNKYACNSSLFC